ncbi:unnamed protein product [Soboliphyme baturini]|uniref:Protein kinase domain-containing protein n=1 Tax=Soboliphyme baturini TaxID=241478 RepID=A0A183IGR5_9BILA|nr:unnamed protein product [Soboliphyme baturini]
MANVQPNPNWECEHLRPVDVSNGYHADLDMFSPLARNRISRSLPNFEEDAEENENNLNAYSFRQVRHEDRTQLSASVLINQQIFEIQQKGLCSDPTDSSQDKMQWRSSATKTVPFGSPFARKKNGKTLNELAQQSQRQQTNVGSAVQELHLDSVHAEAMSNGLEEGRDLFLSHPELQAKLSSFSTSLLHSARGLDVQIPLNGHPSVAEAPFVSNVNKMAAASQLSSPIFVASDSLDLAEKLEHYAALLRASVLINQNIYIAFRAARCKPVYRPHRSLPIYLSSFLNQQLQIGEQKPFQVKPMLKTILKSTLFDVKNLYGLCEDTNDNEANSETDKLLDVTSGVKAYVGEVELGEKKSRKKKEVIIHEPAVLIEGVLFRARYLGSTQLLCDGPSTKASRILQAQEAVSLIKAPEGESQPSTDVDLFISTEKIMVLNTDLQVILKMQLDIMMDHSLRTISYIADIGDLLVIMARRVSQSASDGQGVSIKQIPKMICHVFESEEAQFIAQSIGQAFQVAYLEFLKSRGIEDPGYLRELDYQEVLNSQEIFSDELDLFSSKDTLKDAVVPKKKDEPLGIVIVESGWGSMLPTVVIANMLPDGPAARCKKLNIGDHLIAVNGISLVGLPLTSCQQYIKDAKSLTAVRLTIVPTPPVVEVKIKRPDTKYQLGFSVQNGVICSLLRGGIAERGGVRVGHRIIEINGESVVAVPHEKIVTMLATAVGEVSLIAF